MDASLVDAVSKVDTAFKFIFGISIVILILITAVTLYFLYRYSRKRNPEPADIDGNLVAEIIWTVIPTIIVAAMFWFGWTGYKALRSAPADSYEVQCEARMWSWKFTYPNGKTSDKLYVPANKPIKVDLTSVDVIHSFYAPAFRIKMDTVPGMHTYVWFNSGEPGKYDIQCAEYCGVRHAYMLSKIVVLPEKEFNEWLNETAAVQKDEGEELLKKYGCFDCHSTDGSVLVGPSFKDIYNRETIVVENGRERTLKADDEYLRRAIEEPAAELVKGFEDMMPPFKGTISDEEMGKILMHLKGEKPKANMSAKGAEVAEREGCLGCHSTDGSVIVGPSFKGLMDSKKKVVSKDGKKMEVTANIEYIIGSLKTPEEYISEGFDPSMPAYDSLSDDDVKALVEYISTLK